MSWFNNKEKIEEEKKQNEKNELAKKVADQYKKTEKIYVNEKELIDKERVKVYEKMKKAYETIKKIEIELAEIDTVFYCSLIDKEVEIPILLNELPAVMREQNYVHDGSNWVQDTIFYKHVSFVVYKNISLSTGKIVKYTIREKAIMKSHDRSIADRDLIDNSKLILEKYENIEINLKHMIAISEF